jgi:redox-sensing transcriptional repressor
MSESSHKKSSTSAADGQVPKAVVSRLSLYLRELQRLMHDGQETTSSTHLGRLLGFTDAQVRKDLAYFGQFGHPGIGYRCHELVTAIRRILGTDRFWPVAVIGLGNLGRALLGYRGFGHQGFRIVAAFDVDPAKIGQELDGIPVYALEHLPEVVRRQGIKLGLIAVPAGIEGILNFAPATIAVPDGIKMVGVDLAIELEQLSFAVVNRSSNA